MIKLKLPGWAKIYLLMFTICHLFLSYAVLKSLPYF